MTKIGRIFGQKLLAFAILAHSKTCSCETGDTSACGDTGSKRTDKPTILAGRAAMYRALFILDAAILNGLVISLIFGISVSTLPAIAVKPVLHYATLYKKFQ